MSNQTLIDLRNSDFPTYIRLHTAGLESDFAYVGSLTSKLSFEEEERKYVYGDLLARSFGMVGYFMTSYIQRGMKLDEAGIDELKLDVAGHDLWGMARHLFRNPDTSDFHRYTIYEELTASEKRFVNRMAWFSLVNFVNPNLFGIRNFTLKNGHKMSFKLGYSVSPFGGYFREDVYYFIPSKNLKIGGYLSEYMNHTRMFLAGGISLHNYKITDKILFNGNLDIWSQPRHLDFTTSQAMTGAGISLNGAYKFFKWEEGKSLYANFGLSAKSKGFLPENPSLDSHFKVQMGIIYALE
ncbi:MAG: hypothetical protein Q4G08_03430 [Capnocytophaga sp.]|nr:hypothetical protein [Capnocytophaga sp.]